MNKSDKKKKTWCNVHIHTGIKQIEVDNIEKIAGSKKMHVLSGHVHKQHMHKKREKKKRRGGGEDIKQIPLWSHMSTLREMPTDEYNGNY